MFLEHKHLYRRVKGEVPEGDHTVPIGEARIAREGDELTIVAYGSTVPLAEQAVARARRGHRDRRPAHAHTRSTATRC